MKLHLPKNLRSALLSAALAVSAAPSFAAITPWAIPYDTGQQYATVGSTKEVEFDLSQSWNTEWSIVFSVDAASLKNENDALKTLNLLELDWGASKDAIAGATVSDGELKLTAWKGGGDSSCSFTFPAEVKNITFVVSHDSDDQLSLTAYSSADFSTPLGDTLTKAADTGGNLVGVSFGGAGTGFTNTNFETGAGVGSYNITKAGYSLGAVASSSDLVNYYQHYLTWDGSGGNSWSDASWTTGDGTEGQSFTNYDSVTFATEGANVTLDGTKSVMVATVSENTTINLNSNSLAANSLAVSSGKTLTISGDGILAVANSISGGTGDAAATIDATGASIEFSGATITNTTIKGELKLEGSARVDLVGTVSLGSVVNHLTAGSNNYSLVGDGTVNLTFTGTSDLTNGGSNNFSRIGLNKDSSITIASEAKLKTSTIFSSYTFTDDANASLTVEQKGTLELVGHSSNPNTCVKSLVNHGTITSSAAIGSHKNITNDGTLTVNALYIYNKESTTSSLGGTVNITGALWLGGTTKVSGNVTTGYIGLASGAEAATTELIGDSTGTLNINLASGRATANVALNGSFGINKTGNSTQNFSGNTAHYSGKLDVSGGILNLANMGENSSVTEITIAGGSTLGLYKAGVVTPSTANETTVTFGNGGKLTVGEGGGTLNANVVLGSGSTLSVDGTLNLGSSLTLNGTTLDGALLNQLLSGPCTVTLFSGVDELYIGDSIVNRAGSDFTLTTGEVYAAFALSDEVALLFAPDSETKIPTIAVDYVADGGHITMTSNVPEPATATLSLLALAAMCARRRRK